MKNNFPTFFCVKDASFPLQAPMCAELFSISGVGSLISFFLGSNFVIIGTKLDFMGLEIEIRFICSVLGGVNGIKKWMTVGEPNYWRNLIKNIMWKDLFIMASCQRRIQEFYPFSCQVAGNLSTKSTPHPSGHAPTSRAFLNLSKFSTDPFKVRLQFFIKSLKFLGEGKTSTNDLVLCELSIAPIQKWENLKTFSRPHLPLRSRAIRPASFEQAEKDEKVLLSPTRLVRPTLWIHSKFRSSPQC